MSLNKFNLYIDKNGVRVCQKIRWNKNEKKFVRIFSAFFEQKWENSDKQG